VPRNSQSGRNEGVELEARTSMGRLWRGLAPFSLNANATIISSRVTLPEQISRLGSVVHPLQGQARSLVNAALSYTSAGGKRDVTLLFGATGRRLTILGLYPQPDVYALPTNTLDATASFGLFGGRMKLAARNLTNPEVRQLQGEKEVSSDRSGRQYSMTLSFGS
jgi:outer membrane receptor protein involved in Fe transport